MSTGTMLEDSRVDTVSVSTTRTIAGVGRRGQTQGQVILETRNLTKRFKQVMAVDDLSLGVKTGEENLRVFAAMGGHDRRRIAEML